jgi:type IV pilus assembly protein PilF
MMPIQYAWLTAMALLLAACTTPSPRQLEAQNNVEQAVSRQTAQTSERQRAKVHTELGRLYLLEGRNEIALEEAQIALQSERGYAPAHNLLGLVYMTLRKHELADESFRRALSYAPGDPEINNDYGWFLCQTGKPNESLAYFRLAIANPLFQAPGKALNNAGMCALLIKDERQAEEYFQRALRLERDNPTALYWLADIAYRDGRLADAQGRMKDLHVLMEPNAPSAWLALRIHRKLGDREGEARFMGVLRRKFRDSDEHQKMSRGEFD